MSKVLTDKLKAKDRLINKLLLLIESNDELMEKFEKQIDLYIDEAWEEYESDT